MSSLALITGGHRRLGGAIAAGLARAGYAIAIHGSHDAKPDPDLARSLADSGVEWKGFVADFVDLDSAGELVANVSAAFGRAPDLLVNSASMFGQDRLENVQADDLMRHYAVNCVAPVLLTKAFASVPAGMLDRSIVNILDQRIVHPHGDQLAYTLSKQALAGFTQTMARQLAPAIRVNAVAPGLTIRTDDYDDALMARLTGEMPLHCLSAPQDIADAVLYLARAQSVTGQTIFVDGGAHLKSFSRDFMHL